MYRSFYNLHSKPFSSTADPGFFWAGGAFSKILAGIWKRVKESNGILFLTGEPGTGKTMLANVLADLLDENVLVRTILCLNFDRMDSLNVIASALGLSEELNNEEEFIDKGKQFLHSCHLQGKKALLILDEAQHLDHGALEDLFVLSRHDQQTGGSLSVLFVGHPDLGPVLDREMEKEPPKLFMTRFAIAQLSEKETTEYIRHRMETAGADPDIFGQDALREIYQFTAGCPALINTVCDLALLYGYTEEKKEISRSVIEECEGKLQLAAGRAKKPFVQPLPVKQDPSGSSEEVENTQHPPSPLGLQGAQIRKRRSSMLGARIASLIGAFLVCTALVLVFIPEIRQMASSVFQKWGLRADGSRGIIMPTAPLDSPIFPQFGRSSSGIGGDHREKGQLAEQPATGRHFSDDATEVEADETLSESVPSKPAATSFPTIDPFESEMQDLEKRTASGGPSGEETEREIAAVVRQPLDLQTSSPGADSLRQPLVVQMQKDTEGLGTGPEGVPPLMEKAEDHPGNLSADLTGIDTPKDKKVLFPSGMKKNGLASAADSLKSEMVEKKVVGYSSSDKVILEGNEKAENAGPERVDNPEAVEWSNKSFQLLQENKWDEAIEAASRAIALDPRLPESYANRSWAYIEKEFFEEALADIEIALTISPTFVQAINNKGLVQERTGNQELAMDFYRQACNLGFELSCKNFGKIRGHPPEEEEIKVLLSESVERFGQGDYKAVIDLSSRVIKIDAANAEAFSNRCGAKAVLGMLSEAEEDCKTAVHLDPDFSMAYNNHGVIQERRGDLVAAREFFQKSCDMENSLGCKNVERIGNGK
jgi:general secretion pathway protein A